MATRRVDLLIDQIRRSTENEEFSATTGIAEDEFLQYLNDAQHRLQSVICAQHPTVFVKESTFQTVARTEAYDLPDDAYLNNKITMMEYKETASDEDYYVLPQKSIQLRNSSYYGSPTAYTRRSGKVLIIPTPDSSGYVRINYAHKVAEMDCRRGIIAAVTLDSGTSTITSLTLDTGGTPPIDSTSLGEHEFICIVDKYGDFKMKDIPFDALDTSTGIITIDSSFVYDTGESIAVGDYVVGGKNTTTHSEFPRSLERYLLAYAGYKILKRDSSVDSQEASQELLAMEDDIINSYAHITDDINYIPRINEDDEWL